MKDYSCEITLVCGGKQDDNELIIGDKAIEEGRGFFKSKCGQFYLERLKRYNKLFDIEPIFDIKHIAKQLGVEIDE